MSAAERVKAEAATRVAMIRKVEKLRDELDKHFNVQWKQDAEDRNIDETVGWLLALIEDAPLVSKPTT